MLFSSVPKSCFKNGNFLQTNSQILLYFGPPHSKTCSIFFAIFVCTKELSDICEKINISIQTLWLYLFYILLYITHFITEKDIGELLYIELLSIAMLLICLSELFRNTKRDIL